MADSNRQLQIAELPTDKLSAEHFRMVEAPIPTPGEGEVLARTLLLSLDPANRAWMQGATYRSALNAGQVMAGFTLGRVIESNDPEFAAGDLVEGDGGWQDYFCLAGKRLNKRAPREPLTHLMSVLGVTGNTAYYGMAGIGKPKAGETILVSAAGGATGSVAGQIAKRAGARVVGVAGGPDKCARVVAELGFDECLDYRGANLFQALKEVCPDGIDVYFDNVGGPVSDAVFDNLADYARIAVCGQISQYNALDPPQGPRNLGVLLRTHSKAEGFLVTQFERQHEIGRARLTGWIKDGRLKYREDIVDGFENAPSAFIGLLRGENFGKRLVKVAE